MTGWLDGYMIPAPLVPMVMNAVRHHLALSERNGVMPPRDYADLYDDMTAAVNAHFRLNGSQTEVSTTETETAGRLSCRPAPWLAPFSPAAAAQYLQITSRRVRQLIDKGEIQGTKSGGRWVVDQESVREYEKRKRSA